MACSSHPLRSHDEQSRRVPRHLLLSTRCASPPPFLGRFFLARFVNGQVQTVPDPTNIIFRVGHGSSNVNLREGEITRTVSTCRLTSSYRECLILFCTCRVCFTRNSELLALWCRWTVRIFTEYAADCIIRSSFATSSTLRAHPLDVLTKRYDNTP